MIALLVGSAVLSLFHALIPSHWLPVVAIAKKEHWPIEQTLRVTFLAGCAHVFSTLLLGLGFYWLGRRLDAYTLIFTDLIAPLVLHLPALLPSSLSFEQVPIWIGCNRFAQPCHVSFALFGDRGLFSCRRFL
jgi:hypothetical protein